MMPKAEVGTGSGGDSYVDRGAVIKRGKGQNLRGSRAEVARSRVRREACI